MQKTDFLKWVILIDTFLKIATMYLHICLTRSLRILITSFSRILFLYYATDCFILFMSCGEVALWDVASETKTHPVQALRWDAPR